MGILGFALAAHMGMTFGERKSFSFRWTQQMPPKERNSHPFPLGACCNMMYGLQLLIRLGAWRRA